MLENMIPTATMKSLGSLASTSLGEYSAQAVVRPNRAHMDTPGEILERGTREGPGLPLAETSSFLQKNT